MKLVFGTHGYQLSEKGEQLKLLQQQLLQTQQKLQVMQQLNLDYVCVLVVHAYQ